MGSVFCMLCKAQSLVVVIIVLSLCLAELNSNQDDRRVRATWPVIGGSRTQSLEEVDVHVDRDVAPANWKQADTVLVSSELSSKVERVPIGVPADANVTDNNLSENVTKSMSEKYHEVTTVINDEDHYDNEGQETDDAATNMSACEFATIMMSRKPGPVLSVFFSLCYAVIFVLGLLGNALTIYAINRKREKAAIDTFIASLAYSDIMLCLFAVPITPVYILWYANWVFGPKMCVLFSFAMSSSVFVSTFTLISIAYLRYEMIVHPHNKSMIELHPFNVSIVNWCLGCAVTYPYVDHVVLLPTTECEVKFCGEFWQEPAYRIWFSVAMCFSQYCLPGSAITFFYRSITKKLEQQDRERCHRQRTAPQVPDCQHRKKLKLKRRGSLQGLDQLQSDGIAKDTLATGEISVTVISANAIIPSLECIELETTGQPSQPAISIASSSQPCLIAPVGGERAQSNDSANEILALRDRRARERESRHEQTNKKLLKMVRFFIYSWLPLNLFNLAQDYFENLGHWEYHKHAFLVVHVISCCSVCYNPILYALTSENIRQEVRITLPKFLFLPANWLIGKLSN